MKEDQSFKKPKGALDFETIIENSPFLKKNSSPGRRIAPVRRVNLLFVYLIHELK
jgi:hypothetical protein